MKLGFVLLLALAISCGGKQHQKPSKKQVEIARRNLSYGRVLSPSELLNAEALPNPCEEFKKKIPADWQQGYLETPEDPAKPEGLRIKIFYYGKIVEGKRPTVFFNGGPGMASHNGFKLLTQRQKKIDPEENISFIFIDQRGNGCSAFYPQVENLTNSEGNQIDNKEQIIERLVHYGSRGIVSDAEHVRRHLIGDQKWNVFGQSFGAFVAHRYLQVAPEGVRAAHAHANALTSSPYLRHKNRILSQFRVMEEYLKEYPGDRGIVDFLNIELNPRLHPDRCVTVNKEKFCNYKFLTSLIELLGFTNDWAELHEWLNEFVVDGKLQNLALEKFAAAYMSGTGIPIDSSSLIGVTLNYADNNSPLSENTAANSTGMDHLSDHVIEYIDRNTSPDEKYACDLVAQEVKDRLDLINNGFHECNFIAYSDLKVDQDINDRSNNDTLKHLPRDILSPEMFKNILQENPHIPFYWYSGEFDSLVPKENFLEQLLLIQDLPNVHYHHFMTSGHEGYRTEDLVWKNIINSQ